MVDKIDIKVPDLGEFENVEIIDVLVGAGDEVAREGGLITLETDKATIDVPAPADGTIVEITVSVGDKVSTGDIIGSMTVAGEAAESQVPADDAPQQEEAPEPAAEEEPVAAPADGSGKQTIEVPDLGDFTDVEVIEVHVAAGDEVSLDDTLITLETDKAAMEVPATAAGKIESLHVKVGDKVSQGSPIAEVNTTGAAAPAAAKQKKPAAAAKPAQPASPPPVATKKAPETAPAGAGTLPAIDEAGFSKAHASPSVRKLARELGVDLSKVEGKGAKGRILHDDVKAFVKRILQGGATEAAPSLPKVPEVDFSKFGDIDVQPLTRIQKISGPRLQASWINLPHVTQHDSADITGLEARRQELKGAAKEKGISLTPLAFIMKACIAALKEFPKVNASLSPDGESLVYKHYYHLGFAADTENGLMVPVIRDADSKDVYELASELGSLSAAARDGKLKGTDLQGASFTVSSLGGIGGTAFTPIVNAPEVGILGVSRASMQPVWNGKDFEPRLMLPISFSYDHRVIDGAYAVRFTTFLCENLADVDGLLEAIP